MPNREKKILCFLLFSEKKKKKKNKPVLICLMTHFRDVANLVNVICKK